MIYIYALDGKEPDLWLGFAHNNQEAQSVLSLAEKSCQKIHIVGSLNGTKMYEKISIKEAKRLFPLN